MAPGFVAPLPLASSRFTSQIATNGSVARCGRVPPACRRSPVMQEGLNFDELAKKLASDLASKGIAPPPPLGGNSGAGGFDPGSGPIEVSPGQGHMPRVCLRHSDSAQEVEIYTYGAAVTSWKTRGEDSLWVSDQNKWEVGGKAIRGGIPICFPQFGPYGDLVQHGFARISTWGIEDTFEGEDGSVSAVFTLTNESAGDEIAKWPHKFEATYTVTLSNAGLETNLQVKNTDDKPFDFTMAFHNYFKTSAVSDARVFGYEGLMYNDRLDGDKQCGPENDSGAGLMVEKETDRIYLNAPDELAMFDFASLKVTKLKKTPTLPEATLWNPYGAEGADPGWNGFICIEPACISTPAKLEPGETWVGSQLLGVE